MNTAYKAGHDVSCVIYRPCNEETSQGIYGSVSPPVPMGCHTGVVYDDITVTYVICSGC